MGSDSPSNICRSKGCDLPARGVDIEDAGKQWHVYYECAEGHRNMVSHPKEMPEVQEPAKA